MILFVWVTILILVHIVIASDYASNSAQFDPTGRILKTEYAKLAVTQKGQPIVALRCNDGILLAAARHKRSNKLTIESSKKVYFIDKHICLAASGSLSQAVSLVNAAKLISSRYKEIYSSPIPVDYLCDSLSNEMHRLTREGHRNPLGVSLVVAGWDAEHSHPQVGTVLTYRYSTIVYYIVYTV